MADRPRYYERIETPEYRVQYDLLLAMYSPEMLENSLLGVLWGLAVSPETYPRVLGNMRSARSEPYSTDVPAFRIFFTVGTDDKVLVLWIEKIGEGATELLLS
jgi:hypothetical protein